MTQIDPATAKDGTVLFEADVPPHGKLVVTRRDRRKQGVDCFAILGGGRVQSVPFATIIFLLLDRLREAEAERDRLRKFVGWILDTARDPWIGPGDICGGQLQDAMVEHGLLEAITVVKPCGCNSCECEVGDTCYRDTDLALSCRVEAREPKAEPSSNP